MPVPHSNAIGTVNQLCITDSDQWDIKYSVNFKIFPAGVTVIVIIVTIKMQCYQIVV